MALSVAFLGGSPAMAQSTQGVESQPPSLSEVINLPGIQNEHPECYEEARKTNPNDWCYKNIGPWNSDLLSPSQVRAVMSVEDMIDFGDSDRLIQRYYPEYNKFELQELRQLRSIIVQPMIKQNDCSDTRRYGIQRVDGIQYCYEQPGTMNVLVPSTRNLCPGNNTGRILYRDAYLNFYNSPWRGPVNPLTTCFQFTALVEARSVTIS